MTKCVFIDSIDMSVQGFLYKAGLPVWPLILINKILYLYLTFFIDARTSVGDIQTVARILWGEGGGV